MLLGTKGSEFLLSLEIPFCPSTFLSIGMLLRPSNKFTKKIFLLLFKNTGYNSLHW